MLTGFTQTIKNLPIWVVPLYGVVVLLAVYIFEYGFGYLPCELCLYQRQPWTIVVIGGGLMLMNPIHTKKILWGLSIVMAFSVALAVFHAGVEYGFWAGLDSCSSSSDIATDTSSLLSSLENSTAPSCDKAVWTLFGISLAGFNAILSLDAMILFYMMAKSK
ncbi:MAG: disulfide bond formation protein B [Alphaproteobacteria bacterium]